MLLLRGDKRHFVSYLYFLLLGDFVDFKTLTMYNSYSRLCAAAIFSVFTSPVLSNTVDRK